MSQDYNQPGPPPPPYPGPPAPPAYNPYAYGGAPPPSGGGGMLPWEDRARLGFMPALIETVKLLVTQPSDAFSRLQPNGDLTSPLLFGLIMSWPATVVAMVWQMLFSGMMGGLSGEMAGFGAMQMGLMLVFYPVLFLIGVFIGAGIYHLCLMVLKGLEGSPFGFEGTLKAVCYGSVGSLAQVVPILGGLVAMVVNIILVVVGFRTVHRTSTQTAVLAVLLPIIICCVCVAAVALMTGFGAAMMGAQGG